MKLTRKDLVRAQDAQLKILGVRRKGNAGWLKKTIERDFDPGLIAMFHKVRRKTKADVPKSTRPNRWERKPVVIDGIIMPDPQIAPPVAAFLEQCREHQEKTKDSNFGSYKAAENSDRFAIEVRKDTGDDCWIAVCDHYGVVGVGPTPPKAIENCAFCIESTLLTRATWDADEEKAERLLDSIFTQLPTAIAENQSPEDFANNLFARTERNLA
jgi:hypothetical protein